MLPSVSIAFLAHVSFLFDCQLAALTLLHPRNAAEQRRRHPYCADERQRYANNAVQTHREMVAKGDVDATSEMASGRVARAQVDGACFRNLTETAAEHDDFLSITTSHIERSPTSRSRTIQD